MDYQTDIEVLKSKMAPQMGRLGDSGENKGMDAAASEEAKITHRKKMEMLQSLQKRTNSMPGKPGYFTINSPRTGIILSSDFRENLLGRNVKPGDQLIRVGFTDAERPKLSDWEIELKIPQKHVGQVFRAFESLKKNEELDVDVLFVSEPTRSYRVKLRRDKIASQANTQKDDNNETEPVVFAWARMHGNDIAEADRIPPALLLTGGEVHTRIRCGNRPMGYSLFYGVYEFAYEKVIFPYFHW
jgi:hypothetical protein